MELRIIACRVPIHVPSYPMLQLQIQVGWQYQWEFQDPKMEVLYHIRPYFVGIFPYIGLKNMPYIW